MNHDSSARKIPCSATYVFFLLFSAFSSNVRHFLMFMEYSTVFHNVSHQCNLQSRGLNAHAYAHGICRRCTQLRKSQSQIHRYSRIYQRSEFSPSFRIPEFQLLLHCFTTFLTNSVTCDCDSTHTKKMTHDFDSQRCSIPLSAGTGHPDMTIQFSQGIKAEILESSLCGTGQWPNC